MGRALELLRSYGFLVVIVAALVAGRIVGTTGRDGAEGPAGERPRVRLAYVNWAEGIAMTNLVKVVLEEKLGYEVVMTMADPAPLFTSLANGDNDVFVDAWLPVTHGDYMDEYGDEMVDLGANYRGARIGLVVPAYVEAETIQELTQYRDRFEGRITGIDAGAGIMQRTQEALKEYDLDYNLVASSGPAMTASLKSAIAKEEPIIVTGWKPHWKFARWSLRFLEDPKGVYGKKENLHTITREGLAQDMPELVTFLKRFKMTDATLGDLMGAIQDSDKSPEAVARQWMEDHPDLIGKWTRRLRTKESRKGSARLDGGHAEGLALLP
jgi:glycine betaine/proline transport system substrate-binding protein